MCDVDTIRPALPGDSASIALHRGLGFIAAGVRYSVGIKQGRWLDVVILQRELSGQ